MLDTAVICDTIMDIVKGHEMTDKYEGITTMSNGRWLIAKCSQNYHKQTGVNISVYDGRFETMVHVTEAEAVEKFIANLQAALDMMKKETRDERG